MPFCCVRGTLRLHRPLNCGVVFVVLVLLRQLRRILLHQLTGGAMYLWVRGQFFPHRLHITVARSRQLCLLVGWYREFRCVYSKFTFLQLAFDQF